MRSDLLAQIAQSVFPHNSRGSAAKMFAQRMNEILAPEHRRSPRTVEAYASNQRSIPADYSVAVIEYVKNNHPELVDIIAEAEEDSGAEVSSVISKIDTLTETVDKIEKSVNKLQGATQAAGMLLAIRKMCEDCVGGSAESKDSYCHWSNCSLREYSDMRLSPNAKRM